jgi:hypothetical protein
MNIREFNLLDGQSTVAFSGALKTLKSCKANQYVSDKFLYLGGGRYFPPVGSILVYGSVTRLFLFNNNMGLYFHNFLKEGLLFCARGRHETKEFSAINSPLMLFACSSSSIARWLQRISGLTRPSNAAKITLLFAGMILPISADGSHTKGSIWARLRLTEGGRSAPRLS